jgi:hypothetical protein
VAATGLSMPSRKSRQNPGSCSILSSATTGGCLLVNAYEAQLAFSSSTSRACDFSGEMSGWRWRVDFANREPSTYEL